jgi:hypothetical protein
MNIFGILILRRRKEKANLNTSLEARPEGRSRICDLACKGYWDLADDKTSHGIPQLFK